MLQFRLIMWNCKPIEVVRLRNLWREGLWEFVANRGERVKLPSWGKCIQSNARSKIITTWKWQSFTLVSSFSRVLRPIEMSG